MHLVAETPGRATYAGGPPPIVRLFAIALLATLGVAFWLDLTWPALAALAVVACTSATIGAYSEHLELNFDARRLTIEVRMASIVLRHVEAGFDRVENIATTPFRPEMPRRGEAVGSPQAWSIAITIRDAKPAVVQLGVHDENDAVREAAALAERLGTVVRSYGPLAWPR